MSATRSTIPRPQPPMLAFLYTELRWGCPDIGFVYERDAKTVLWWLRQAQIPTMPRGSDQRVHLKPGHKMNLGRKRRPDEVASIRAATIARGGVPYLRDGKHWLAGAAPEENPNWKGGVTPERQEFYRSPEWKAACREVWARADACCERCGRDHRLIGRTVESFHVHHIVTFAVRELRAVAWNLALLCRGCHLFVHSKANTLREFLASPHPRAEELEAEAA